MPYAIEGEPASEYGDGWDHSDVTEIARSLDEALRLHEQIKPPGVTDIDTAYAIQDAWSVRRAARLASGLAGYKIALTSPEAQAALQADEPARGSLLQADLRTAGTEIDLATMFQPLVEVEAMFRVVRDLPAGATFEQVVASCEVTAGFECPDGRCREWFGGSFPVLSRCDIVADNCLAGVVVVGESWVAVDAVDLGATSATLTIDGRLISSGPATDVLGNPVNAVVWLSRHLALRGRTLPTGTLVSSGTYTPPIVARAGVIEADFGEALGRVKVRFRANS